MNKFYLKSSAILGCLGVGLGAFGAHAFEGFLSANNRLETFETAVKYQFYGAFSLLGLGILTNFIANKYINWSANLFLIGTVIFSGSLYVICISGIKLFGAVAPIGGSCLILGWLFLFIAVKNHEN